MKYNFCTLFDSYYLSRGLALYSSLSNNCDNFHLYIYAFDDNCYSTLIGLSLDNTTIISLCDFETPELLLVKNKRTIAEYCWTSTASTIWHSIYKFNLDHCTYLDSDIYFFSSPEPIFKELENYSVGITPHNFSKNLKSLKIYGNYCVQFVYIKNDSYGITALDWWRKSCLEWCFAKLEQERYGDQKYLDKFPQQFEKVKIINHIGSGIAPWNISNFCFKKNHDTLLITSKNYLFNFQPLIFYHFQGLKYKIGERGVIAYASPIKIDDFIQENIYKPYITILINIACKFNNQQNKNNIIFKRGLLTSIFFSLRLLIKKSSFFVRIYSIINLKPYNKPKGIGGNIS